MTTIDQGLAVSMAGMVAVGLTPGDDQLERSLAALLAVGLMLTNATDDERVHEALASADRTVIERQPDGSLLIRVSALRSEEPPPPHLTDLGGDSV